MKTQNENYDVSNGDKVFSGQAIQSPQRIMIRINYTGFDADDGTFFLCQGTNGIITEVTEIPYSEEAIDSSESIFDFDLDGFPPNVFIHVGFRANSVTTGTITTIKYM